MGAISRFSAKMLGSTDIEPLIHTVSTPVRGISYRQKMIYPQSKSIAVRQPSNEQKWLFVFNSNFLRTNQRHRSRGINR